jgi:hypothetical protein
MKLTLKKSKVTKRELAASYGGAPAPMNCYHIAGRCPRGATKPGLDGSEGPDNIYFVCDRHFCSNDGIMCCNFK